MNAAETGHEAAASLAASDGYRPPGWTSEWARVLRRIAADRFSLAAAVVLVTIVVITAIAPAIVPFDPTDQDLGSRLRPPGFVGQGGMHLFGTDQLGRDVFSRVLVAGRISIVVAAAVVLIAGTIGTVIGMCAGYFGGYVDTVLMRIVDLWVAFPGLLLTLAVLAIVGTSMTNLILILVLTGWMVYARNVRGKVLALREQLFIDAAVANGAPPVRVIFRHILPNVGNPLIPLAMLELSRVVLVEAILSFLGMGIQPPDISWGLMVSDGRNAVTAAWWLSTFPGLAIMVVALAVNIVAARLRTPADVARSIGIGATCLSRCSRSATCRSPSRPSGGSSGRSMPRT